MKTKKQLIKNGSKYKLATGVFVRFILFAIYFVQAHWMSIACATGTIAAATVFGDKAYWVSIDKKAEKLFTEKKPEEAVTSIEAELAKYLKWREQEENSSYVSNTDQRINDLYFQMAKAKEAAGFDKNKVVDAYKLAIISPTHSAEALAWLSQNTSYMQYQDVFGQVIQEAAKSKQSFLKVIQQLEKNNNWNAFEFFLDTVVENTPDSISAIKLVENSMGNDSKWKDKFIEYYRSKPKLAKYAYEKDCGKAEEFTKKGEFKKAIVAYRYIANRYDLVDQKAEIEFNICQNLFNDSDYGKALSELSGFLERNKAKNSKLVKDALLLKGQCYIQLGEIDKATNEFLAFLIQYPKEEKSPEAGFFVGYCYMLQGKFEQAKEALDVVVKDYPQSSFAKKAKLCLARIESMAE
jgi:tetratricopeptide (TPR) repeat protein